MKFVFVLSKNNCYGSIRLHQEISYPGGAIRGRDCSSPIFCRPQKLSRWRTNKGLGPRRGRCRSGAVPGAHPYFSTMNRDSRPRCRCGMSDRGRLNRALTAGSVSSNCGATRSRANCASAVAVAVAVAYPAMVLWRCTHLPVALCRPGEVDRRIRVRLHHYG